MTNLNAPLPSRKSNGARPPQDADPLAAVMARLAALESENQRLKVEVQKVPEGQSGKAKAPKVKKPEPKVGLAEGTYPDKRTGKPMPILCTTFDGEEKFGHNLTVAKCKALARLPKGALEAAILAFAEKHS